MLRGYSRHDGISNQQSARERDRDRQRERQRQERAQMLPNDDKDISTSAQDLFQAPVKVDPSVEDRTTVEIRNTLGNFESVKHYVVDSSSGRSLIGVDQNSNPSSVHNPSRPSVSRSLPQPTLGVNKPPPTSRSGPFPVPPIATSISQTNPKSSNSTQKVPLSLSHLPQHSSQSGNNNSTPSVSANNPHGQASSVKKSGVYNNVNSNSGSVVESSAIPSVLKVENTSSNNNNLNNNNNNSGCPSVETISAENPNDKHSRSYTNRKPALERVDPVVDSIFKEMIDVTAPITAIQTPIKESPVKKYTPRRASKSEEKIFDTIREGMTNIPSPLQSMETSESSSTDTETSGSDSEESSSGSQGGVEAQDPTVSKPAPTTNSPTRWNLESFMKNNVKGTPDSSGTHTTKSPKDGERRDPRTSNIDSEESPGEVPTKVESNVTSTSIFGKSTSSSPLESASSSMKFSTRSSKLPHPETNEGPYTKVPGKSPRKTPDVKGDAFLSSKQPAQTIPSKGPATSKGVNSKPFSSLSASSSEDEGKKPKEQLKEKKTSSAMKRRHSSSSSERHGNKSDDDDSSPEANKTKKVVQDENKVNTIRKLFRPHPKKVESPNIETEGSKGGGGNSGGRGKGAKATANRVSAKDNGRKNNSTATALVHNGDLVDGKASAKGSSSSAAVAGKNRESALKDLSHSPRRRSRKKDSHKSRSNASGASTSNKFNNEGAPGSNVISPVINLSAGSRTKDETSGKSHPSSLMCRIPLSVLPRPPVPPSTTASSSVVVKSEKEPEKAVANESSHRVRLHYDPGRVGSSSDHATNPHDPFERQRDDPMCSDSERTSVSRKRPKKKPRSPKKNSRIKREPDSHSKIEEDPVEVSSNVWTPCDSLSVSTTRTPPVELDIAPAPDSSLNPPHLPSPVVPQQPIYYSYFERNNDAHEDYYTRDQESYLEEAKRLKHKADNEKLSTTQASTYLEAGLYFILTGLSMERDRQVGSQSAFTMYKDTLSLIRYIGTRFRSSRNDYTNAMEAKIIVLSMRCQSLLSLKLFKIKMRETKDVVQYLHDHFQKAPPDAPIPNSPQLSTPSPHSPTSSPAGSSGILQAHTPSPHPHQNHHVATVPRSIYSQMYKNCTNTMNLINAHEWWETADSLVEKYHMEDFFISIDRQYGPLTMHNSLVDLVRYVKHGLKTLKMCSDIT